MKFNITKWATHLRNVLITERRLNDFMYAYEYDKYSYKSTKVNLGQIQTALNVQKTSFSNLSELEFQVFSQFGDDGIIQWLIHHLDIGHKSFVEFGVERYTESNTRFLLFNNKWEGLVIDGDAENIYFIRNNIESAFFNLKSVCSFITKDNIADLISSNGFGPDMGLLSIDIDGNDYWVWKALADLHPVIVIVEYNAEFGLNPWVIPYQADFVWDKKDAVYYWGASLPSLCHLAEEKGYSFVGCNSHGNNAYFIRNDKMKNLKKLSCEEGFVLSKFNLSRKPDLTPFSTEEKRQQLVGKKVFNTVTSQMETISF